MNKPSKFLLVIGGPTASGKTKIAIKLAQHFKTEVISADSRQFYREMTIGTAKPSEQELQQAPHHFINSFSIHDAYTVGDFERDALALLNRLFKTHQMVVMTGGSGLFIRAVCEGLDEFPEVPGAIREKWQKAFEEKGLAYLQKQLEILDPAYFKKVDIYNSRRLIRALEVCDVSGKPYSFFLNENSKERDFTPIYIKLEWERALLYDRINQRVDQMMENGLQEEARNLYPFRKLKPLQTVGYQELFDFFEGNASLSEAVDLIKQNSRRYAKRQMTWFRKREAWKAFHPDQIKEMLEHIYILTCV